MTIPVWVGTAILGVLCAQFFAAVLWAIHADRRLALVEQTLQRIATQLDRHSLDVIADKVARLERDFEACKREHNL